MKRKQELKKENRANNAIVLILIVMMFFTIVSVEALPQIQLISQTNPIEYGEVQTITLNITFNGTNITNATTITNATNITNATSITNAVIEFDSQNHTLQQQGLYYVYTWIPQSRGTQLYIVYASDELNETQSYSGSFTVQDSIPPEIIETQPRGTINYNLVELKALTDENSICKYDSVDVSYDSMYFGLSGTGTIHTKLRNFGDGNTVLYVKCKDSNNNIGTSRMINFTIDALPPTIYDITPTGTVKQSQNTLKFYTNEHANCRWSLTNQVYDGMVNQFQTTGYMQHEQSITLSEGINTYYLSCKDQTGNINPTIAVNIELNIPPTASVRVKKNESYEALTSKTYEIELSSSEPLSQAPSLRLQYSSRIINIPLEGTAQTWKGYLIIPSDSGESVGEFIYSGIDLKGMSGTEITSGKLIIIDTSPPPVIQTLNLANENNKIKISWNYEGEDANHFNIYRSTTGNTDKTNFKATATSSTFFDSDITNKIGYFYRVSAVDEAGNEGPLSEEIFLMTDLQNVSSEFHQDPEILLIINQKITMLEGLLQDVDARITRLEGITDKDLVLLITQENLVTKLKESKNKIQLLVGELKTYRETRLSSTELNTKLEIISTKLEEYKTELVKEVRLRNRVESEQVVDQSLLLQAADAYLKNKPISEEQKQEYYKLIQSLQDGVRIMQRIADYEVEYDYAETEHITTITESVLSPKELKGVVVQELIPKDVIKISEISFATSPDDFNSLGVSWALEKLEGAQVNYQTFEEKDLSQLQKIRTVLLYDSDEFLSILVEQKIIDANSETTASTNSTNQITGGVISLKKLEFTPNSILIILGILMVSLIIYYVFLMKPGGRGASASDQEVLGAQKIGANIGVDTNIRDANILFSLIQQAYACLEQGNTDGASAGYNSALEFYAKANLGFKDRMKANLLMNTLRERLVKVLVA